MSARTNNTLQAFWVGMGSLSSFGLAIVSAAILSRYFDKVEYGTYRQVVYVYNTLLVIFSAGLPKVFSYYLPRYNLNQGKAIVRKITILLFAMGFILSLVLFSFSGIIAGILNNEELSEGLKWFSPIPMFLLPTLGIEGIFSTYKKTIFIAIYNTISRLLMLLFIVLPVILLEGTYLHAIYGWIVVSLLTFFLALYFKGIPFKGVSAQKVDLTSREVFSYSLPILVASLAGVAISSADQFFISRYFGAQVFAEYSNGFIQLPFVGMITAATSTVLFPEFSRLLHGGGDNEKIVDLWRNALTKSAVLIYPLVLFFLFNADSVIKLLFSSAYENSVIYFQIAMLVNFFNIIVFAPLLLSSGKVRIYSNVHIVIAVLVWLCEFAVVLIFNNPIAVAIVSVSSAILKILILTFFSAHIIGVALESLFPLKNICLLIAHSLVVISLVRFCMNMALPELSDFFMLVSSFSLFALLLLSTARLFNVNYFFAVQPLYERATSIYRKFAL